MQLTAKASLPNALLISISTPHFKGDEAIESLAELARLVTTLGFKVVGTQSQKQSSTQKVNVLGSGKLAEIAHLTGNKGSAADEKEGENFLDDDPLSDMPSEIPSDGLDFACADVVVFDCDLTPSQLRNVENQLGVEVFDRTGIIIEIFSRHARTKTAKLQVEIARLNYVAPRLRETSTGDKERQMGKGAGETTLELNRRKVRDQLAELKRELVNVQDVMMDRREQRSELFSVALIGYTNAGKSSMMRAITGSDVEGENKLFATLDTTVRALYPITQPRILVSDTVGFIKKLPHDLVASFHSTLAEAHDASLLLYVVDASDASFRSQLDVVHNVLAEVGVQGSKKLLVLNKSDQLSDAQQQALMAEFPDAMMTSTRNPADIAKLHKYIVDTAQSDMIEEEVIIPYTAKGIVGEIRSTMSVIKEEYEYSHIKLTVRSNAIDLERLKKRMLNL
ncbi:MULTISPECIES: GTPase HflX [Pseudoalteromonas]|uniref:GTPase HflX n=1 Tax=Pseudoalteromonas nigrifaciens TaxID=28109 RepID=A0AAC9UIK1_9GAMM|nr:MULTISPECIES: GTPase HflX [Pseudoalteromonas]ASM53949.1 GTP-binding protein HflX [Pseudoalteromonas nigrifaciens]MBE0421737.1 GTPase HflX [Pseudoalteromonas nigrifaciens]GEN41420.1 GTPase HflX [Pseudoalteromonas nigrifaciens]SUC52215.1 GTP-binding protein HflX [Pseudoalteromonas nigrifaciens]|tara:strand:+ start:9053 stop:10405 length:1353 start_codon:yes stop_codon:yes gene_type:complete